MNAPKAPPPGSMPPGIGSPDVSAMMDQMMQQQGGNTAQAGAGGTSGMPAGLPGAGANQAAQRNQPPRAIGTPLQEAKYLAGDVAKGTLGLLPDYVQKILGVLPTDTPEEAARKKQMIQKYQSLNAEDKAYFDKRTQELAARKKQEEEALARQKQLEKQNKQEFVMPQGKTRGEGGPGASKKQNTMAKLQNDRKRQLTSSG